MENVEANLKERFGVREQIEDSLENLNVIITTYGMAKGKEDNRFLRHLKPVVSVTDDGPISRDDLHMLIRLISGMRLRRRTHPQKQQVCWL